MPAHVSMTGILWDSIDPCQRHPITFPHKNLRMTVGDRIREARKARGLSRPELAKRSGVKYPTLAGIENDDQTTSSFLPDIADALKVELEWLRTGRGRRDSQPISVESSDWADITAYSQQAAAGDGLTPEEYAETHSLKFKASSLQRKGLFARKLHVFYARGDSMEPRIHDGDALLFDAGDTVPRDGVIYVVRYQAGYMVKRLHQYGNQWFLVSDNSADPKWRKPVPVDFTEDFEVLGRVRWIGSWED